MIKANEVRIGNWIRGGGPEGVWLTVDEVLHDGKLICYPNNGKEVLQVEIKNPFPIQLTPEILEKAGAGKDGCENVLSVGALKMKLRYHKKWYCELGGIYLGDNIQHLHQLQNIYFAFLGRELEINL